MVNKKKKWFLFLILVLPLIYFIASYHYGIHFYQKSDNPGFSYVNGQTVYYYYYNEVSNKSIFPKKIQVRAFSDIDKGMSLVADAEIEITSIEVWFGREKYVSEYYDTFFIPPFGECRIRILGEAPYGGKGKAERHGPNIEIISEEVYWEYWTEGLPYMEVNDEAM